MKNLIILSILILTSCAHNIPDEPVCLEVKPNTGYCTFTISPKFYFVRDEEWRKLKSESLVMPIKSWKEIKTFILNVCKDYGQCDAVEPKVKQIESFIH